MLITKNKINYPVIILALVVSISIISCDKGIAPYPAATAGLAGFDGKVTFYGTWPAGIQQTYIVAFKQTLQSSSDFFPPNLSYVVGPIPYGATEYSYNSIDNNAVSSFTLSPGSYNYVVVVQSTKPTLSLNRSDWTVVGIYYLPGDTTNPGTMIIQSGEITHNINITCNFDNPPPQPPQKAFNKNE
jgi:hypothetical protein